MDQPIRINQHDNRIIGAEAIAQELGVATATVYGWATDPNWKGLSIMPFYRTINRRLFVLRDDLAKLRGVIG